jgi:hypothetical protein
VGAAPIRAHLALRREQLAEYNPAALDVAAEVLAAIHGAGDRHAAALRADKTDRYRRAQLWGEHGLPLEDLAAIALESPEGREVVLAGLRVFASALGCALGPAGDAGEDFPRALAACAKEFGEAIAAGVEAGADGAYDPEELDQLEREFQQATDESSRALAAIREARAGRRLAVVGGRA